ncbi:hypothetical protein GCM10011504_12650 [Siccirubricoccus deserti]|nr:YciI family protein [Siccirubricoccus deserti]GGC35770.1 hypothetical protein GCM10011504_12650 [Siccirubricoccus deserti]
MGFVLIGDDGTDAAAPARREAARIPHVESIRRNAAAGRLVMSGPRLRADGSTAGSLQFFEVPSMVEMAAYLATELFHRDGIWVRHAILPFRIAPLPWAPQPGRPGGEAGPLHAFAVIARDGTDAEAPRRRLAVRPRHFARLGPEVAAGRIRIGGAILDMPDGAMVGSIIALALPDEAAVQDWLATEPYVTEGVWQDLRVERWRIGVQPYPPLPGSPA